MRDNGIQLLFIVPTQHSIMEPQQYPHDFPLEPPGGSTGILNLVQTFRATTNDNCPHHSDQLKNMFKTYTHENVPNAQSVLRS